MQTLKSLAVILITATLFASGCKPKDTDIRSSVEEKLKANPATAPVMVSVDKGVASLSGEVASDQDRAESEKIASGVKGVKSVVNNVTVAVPAPPVVATPPVVAADDAITTGARDAVKDFPGVNATVVDGVVTLTGTVSKDDQRKIMMSVSALKPKKIDNKLTIK